MKIFLRLLLTVLLLTPFFTQAELLIYKGTARFKFVGDGISRSVPVKSALVFDHQTTQAVVIAYGSINGFKFYGTDSVTNLHVVQVTGNLGKGYTALTQQRTQCDLDADNRSESVFCQGADSVLKIYTNSTTVFPKTMSSVGMTVSFLEASEIPVIAQENVTINFNSLETIQSNTAGETLEEAAGRLSAQLESLGYVYSAGKGQRPTLIEQLRAMALQK
jgi:hypothetical protein